MSSRLAGTSPRHGGRSDLLHEKGPEVGNAEKARQIAEQLAALAMVQMGHAKTQDVVQQWSGLISAALADAKREALTEVVALAEAELQNARDNPLQPYDYYLSTLVNALRQLKLRAQENPRG